MVEEIDEALAQLDKFERTRRKMRIADYIVHPAAFGASATFAAMAIVAVEWWSALLNIAVAVLNWHLGQHSMQQTQKFGEQLGRHRRKLHWYRLIAIGEEHRRANTEGGRMAEIQPVVMGVLVCEKHAAPFKAARANLVVAGNKVASSLLTKMVREKNPTSPEEFLRYATELSRDGRGACCQLGDDVMAEILSTTPPSTGDSDKDVIAAVEVAQMEQHNATGKPH